MAEHNDAKKIIKETADYQRTIAEHKRTIAEQERTIAEQERTIAEQERTIAQHKERIDIEKKKVIEISEVVEQTSMLLSRVMELRDPYTKGHSEHVGEIAVNFVTLNPLLNFPKEKIPVIYRAALLHDIGKIGISEQVLNKPTKLTEAELVMIKYHTNLGYNLIKPFLFDKLVGDAILYHHENFDGSGYPEGLKGDEIPLIARIFRIADYYDALTSSRPYRPALEPEVALRIMKGDSRCFDPNLFSFFVESIEHITKKASVPSEVPNARN
ncbi:MAG: HD domain-containing protein [Deltaproteobacteria bacterium]|nr:HD domain-containing protein [Deltaproteobacteria bacterium]